MRTTSRTATAGATSGTAALPSRVKIRAEIAELLGSEREARWLVEEVLGPVVAGQRGGTPWPSTSVEAVGVPGAMMEVLWAMARRRACGEPLQYVLGHWPFRSLDLAVDSRALIPRPETEHVVDVALGELGALATPGEEVTIVDLGTGSGAIALSMALEGSRLTKVQVFGTDVDSAALDLARLNRARACSRGFETGLAGDTRRSCSALSQAAVASVRFCAGSWWAALPSELRGRVRLGVSNPPYVAEEEWGSLDPEIRRHEPRRALVAGPGSEGTPGLACIEEVLRGAPHWLGRPASAVLEIAPHQAEAAAALARSLGADAQVLPDLSRRPRVLVARWHGHR